MNRQFLTKVLDHEKKSGLFWDTYKVTFRFLETGAVVTYEVSPEQYYDMPIGSEGKITLYQHSDNRWYSVPQQ